MSLFRVYVDGALFYHPQMSKLAITDARIEEDAENIDSMPLSAPFNHPYLKRYNDIYRVQMPNITPHVCRHTYCSNQAKAGMNPKTLQYLMGHSDIGVTLNTYTHLGLEDAAEELHRMEEAENARREQEKLAGKTKDAQKLFKAV